MKKSRSMSRELAVSSLAQVSGGGNPQPQPWLVLEPTHVIDRILRPPPLPWLPEIVIGSGP